MGNVDLDALHTAVSGLMLAMPRALVMMSVVPLLAKRNLGGFMRAAVAAALCLPMMPLLLSQLAAAGAERMTWWPLLVVKESCLGLVIGFSLALPFWAAEAVGFIVDNQRGAGVAAQSNPLTEDESSPMGVLVHIGFVVVFISLGGVELVVGLLYDSFKLWPVPAGLPEWQPGTEEQVLRLFDKLMRLSVIVAGPAMVLMLLSELSLALVSMFAPQLQVYQLAMGIKSGVAMFVMAVYVGVMFDHLTPEVLGLKDLLAQLRLVLR